MSVTNGNVKVYLKVMVGGEEYLKNIHFQMCFIKVPFDKLVQHIQDSARTRCDMPHFLAESITMTIDHQTYPFSQDTPFYDLIYKRKDNTKAIHLTMEATIQETKPPKLSHKIFTATHTVLPTPQRSVSRGRSQSSISSGSLKTASTSSKSNGLSRASSATMNTATPARQQQNAADLPAVPVIAAKPAPATTFISISSAKSSENLEETQQNAETSSEDSAVMPPPAPTAEDEAEAAIDTEVEVAQLSTPAVPESELLANAVEPVVAEVVVEEVATIVEVSSTPVVQEVEVASQSPKVAKTAPRKKKSSQLRKKYKGKATFTIKNDNGEVEGYETPEGSESEASDSESDDEEEELVVEKIAAPEVVPVVAPSASAAVEPTPAPVEEIVTVHASAAEVEAPVQQEEVQQEENISPVTNTEIDSSRCKTPEKTRSLSNPRGGCRASATKATACSASKSKPNKRLSAYTPATPLYSAGPTFAEAAHQFENNLHRTTGSILTGHSHAPFNPNGSLGSATKMPRSTPAKKAPPAKSANTSTASQELSPIRMSVPRSGRPSIGTIETQWEYMRSNFFNNDDEEIVWSMVSKKKGAYKHAHQKYENAEDGYFKCIQMIGENEAKLESLKSGLAAQIVAILGQLNNLCKEYELVKYTPQVAENYKAALEKLKKIDETKTEYDLAFNCFAKAMQGELEALFKSENWDTDVSKSLRSARKMFNRLDKEKENLAHALENANKRSEHALEYMEKWSRREKEALDYADTMRNEINDWLHENYEANCEAYEEMRKFIPVNIWDLQVAQLMELSRAEGGCLSLELATEIKQNKLLHWIVTHPDDIATDSFLTGDKKAIFENLESLDILEMRAIAYQLPAKFENDKDGKKNDWRARFFARVRQLASQEQGVLVKGAYDPIEQKRVMIAQPALKPEQKRRAVYFYRTKEKSLIKIKQYTDRIALLARRENAVVTAKAAVQETKAEYDVLLQESRDPAFIKEYGTETLTELKDVAKGEWQAALSTLKCAEQDLSNLRKTIESMPLTFDQYKEQEAELVAFLANSATPIDWNQRGLAAQPVLCEFDNSAVIEKAVKVGLKFVSAEEEAAQRKADLEALMARRNESAAVAAVEGETETSRSTPVDFAIPFSAVPCTPGAEDTAVNTAGTATAPNTEFKKLSTAALGIFSPTTARSQSEYSLNCIAGAGASAGAVTPFETPRKRNSVLLNANPEMLNTLNKMLMNSPAATPAKNSRQSLFGAPSASKFAAKIAAAADGDENSAAPEVKPVTRSKLLMRKLTPHSLMGGGSSLSPKRSATMPKLSFLAQLTGRAKAVSNEDGDDSTPAVPSAAPALRGPGALGAPRGPMGLFADIARFRKPDAEEVTMEGNGKAISGGVNGREESASGEKENSSALDNVDSSKPVSSAFKKASSTSSIMGIGMMMGGPGGALKMPMMSMFDEIRKRRVIE